MPRNNLDYQADFSASPRDAEIGSHYHLTPLNTVSEPNRTPSYNTLDSSANFSATPTGAESSMRQPPK